MKTLKKYNDFLKENKDEDLSQFKKEITTTISKVFPKSKSKTGGLVIFSFDLDDDKYEFDIKLEWDSIYGDEEVSSKELKSKSELFKKKLNKNFIDVKFEIGEDKLFLKGLYKIK